MNQTFDARGMACPLPVVNAKKITEEMGMGDVFTILVDNEIAVSNLTRFATHKGYEVESQKKEEQTYEVTMKIVSERAASHAEQEEFEISCKLDGKEAGMCVVLSSDVMGQGEEKLGKALMKAFVFALTKQDALPETILCYNKGAYLSCQDADTLEDLKALEAEGVAIYTCGTCLDYYGIKDKLAVGSVTNMYEIVEKMQTAKKLIRP